MRAKLASSARTHLAQLINELRNAERAHAVAQLLEDDGLDVRGEALPSHVRAERAADALFHALYDVVDVVPHVAHVRRGGTSRRRRGGTSR